MGSNKNTFKPSPERIALIRELRKLAPGQHITYAALEQACNFDPRAFRRLTYDARVALQMQHSAVIEVVKDGFRRLTDTEVVNFKAPQYQKRARGAARRGTHALATVEYDALNATDQREHNVRMSSLGAIRLVTGQGFSRRLRAKVDEVNKELEFDSKAMLKLFDGIS